MTKRKVVKKLGGVIMDLGNKAVGKSLILGLYEPKIPEILKNIKNESERFLKK